MLYDPHVLTISYGTPLYDASVALRDLVLRKPLGIRFAPYQFREEWKQLHLVYLAPGINEVVGVLVLSPLDRHRVKMRQVAVHPDFQGQGIGQYLVLFSEKYAKYMGFKEVVLHARMSAVEFYKKIGYSQDGDVFEEVGLLHVRMQKSFV